MNSTNDRDIVAGYRTQFRTRFLVLITSHFLSLLPALPVKLQEPRNHRSTAIIFFSRRLIDRA
ncbi:hypothetical protein BDW72DRAFT_79889 [Aspergillus terricola var. indicus]